MRKLRKSKGLTQEQLALKLHIKRTSYTRYETNDRSPDLDTLINIADIYGITVDDIINPNDYKTRIPVLGSVAAGIPIEAIENIEDYEDIPISMSKKGEYFALKIKGKSMEPKFSEDDVIIVKKQNTIESGEIAVVIVNGNEATVKKIIKQKNGITLMATNTDVYSPTFYSNDDIETLPVIVIGKVVELRAKFL